ncbi:MAG: response regulator [Acidobacteria bacterium]|nr:response regulator [Acidobacteriota bacterium]
MAEQDRALDRLVKREQLELSYRWLPRSVALALLAPLVFAWLMRPLFADRALVSWLGVIWLAALLRWLLWYRWSRTGFEPAGLGRWSMMFWSSSAAAALAWAGGATTLLASADPRESMMLAIMMLAVAAIGANPLGSHLPSAVTFIVVILSPVALEMMAASDPVVRIAGLAVVAGVVALVATVFRAHRELASLIRTDLRLSAAVAEAVEARSAAEQASVAKSEFLANMSHELRTPLNAILGYSEMLCEDARAEGAAATAADLEKIARAGRHLLALITDVLDLSKIEAGRMDLHVGAVDAAGVVRQVIDTSETLAAAGGNRLSVEGLETLGTLQTDALKLQQVLLNLVGNACKFTSNGRIRVAGRREPAAPSDWVVFDVSDTGLGMTPEEMSRLFGQFMQADSSTTRRFGGTGLGLAISQQLCHLMGGAITVRSQAGQGSTFTVRVPALAPGYTASACVPVAGPELSDAPSLVVADLDDDDVHLQPAVLVVDDDGPTRELAIRVLRKADFMAIGASSAGEGLRMALARRPLAIVLDLLLPDSHGWRLLHALRAAPSLRGVPVIVVSIIDDRAGSLALGAAEHLVKPAHSDQLVDSLLRATGDRTDADRGAAPPASGAATPRRRVA